MHVGVCLVECTMIYATTWRLLSLSTFVKLVRLFNLCVCSGDYLLCSCCRLCLALLVLATRIRLNVQSPLWTPFHHWGLIGLFAQTHLIGVVPRHPDLVLQPRRPSHPTSAEPSILETPREWARRRSSPTSCQTAACETAGGGAEAASCVALHRFPR